MKARSRMWSLDAHAEAVESIIQVANSPEGKDLLLSIEPEERADAILERLFEERTDGLLGPLVKSLRDEFSNEAWNTFFVQQSSRSPRNPRCFTPADQMNKAPM